jgi:SWI/SNF-related matrix-associated actin-dependent regulator of chromatin subfamily A-like protein 1
MGSGRGGVMKLRKYQREGVDFLRSRRSALLGDEQGIGKTIQAVVASCDRASILVIVPAQLRLQWKGYFVELLNREVELIKDGNHLLDDFNPCTITSYGLMTSPKIFKQLKERMWSVIIFDEAHYLQSSKALRTKKAIGRGGLHKNAGQILMLTGSPFLSNPKGLYPMLKTFVEDFRQYDFMTFTQRYCGGHYNRLGFWEAKGATHQEELKEKLKGFMLRRLSIDVLPEIPDRVTEIVPIESDISALEKKIEGHYTNQGSEGITRKEIGLLKLPACIEYLEYLLEKRDKILVFAYHREVVEKIQEHFGDEAVKLYGGMSEAEKMGAVDSFRGDRKVKVLVGNIQAAGQGIDGLQYACNDVVFVEWSWVPEEIRQAIRRVQRFGVVKKTYVKLLTVGGSLEEKMIKTLLVKNEIIQNIVGVSDELL